MSNQEILFTVELDSGHPGIENSLCVCKRVSEKDPTGTLVEFMQLVYDVKKKRLVSSSSVILSVNEYQQLVAQTEGTLISRLTREALSMNSIYDRMISQLREHEKLIDKISVDRAACRKFIKESVQNRPSGLAVDPSFLSLFQACLSLTAVELKSRKVTL